MNKRIVGAIASAGLALAGLAATAAPQAQADTAAQAAASQQAAPQVAQTATGVPYTGYRFANRNICIQNNIGTYWDIDSASEAFNSGVNTVITIVVFPAWGDPTCAQAGFSASQTIFVGTQNVANNNCFALTLSVGGDNKYDNRATVAMNVGGPVGCDNTAQRRNAMISQALGTVFGLKEFTSSCCWQASIMNNYNEYRYNFAGVDDRNALYNLY